MKKLRMKKIWIYSIIGISILVIGLLSWGFATNWKFIPENTAKSSSSGGSEIPSATNCSDQNCENGQICVKNTIGGDGTKSKCCNPDEVLDAQGDMCCPKNLINPKTGVCCDGKGKLCTWENKPGQKVCCENCDNKGCYTDCGDIPCRNDNQDCIANKYCITKGCDFTPPEKLMTQPVSQSCPTNQECNYNEQKCTPGTNCTYTTIGTCSDNSNCDTTSSNKYKFIYRNADQLPKNWDFIYKSSIPIETGTSCSPKDCDTRLKIEGQGNAGIDNDKCLYTQVGKSITTIPQFKNDRCPFTDKTMCCQKSKTDSSFSGQICPASSDTPQMCAFNDQLISSGTSGGFLSECVDTKDCIGDDGKVCGGIGTCVYDPTLNDGNGGGKCNCTLPKYKKLDPDKTKAKYCATTIDYDSCAKDYKYDITTNKLTGKVSGPVCGDTKMGGSICKGDNEYGCCGQQSNYCEDTTGIPIISPGCLFCGHDINNRKCCKACDKCYTDRGCGPAQYDGPCVGDADLSLIAININSISIDMNTRDQGFGSVGSKYIVEMLIDDQISQTYKDFLYSSSTENGKTKRQDKY